MKRALVTGGSGDLGKAMIVGMTRNICVRLYNEIIALKPQWHNDDLDKGIIKVVMTSFVNAVDSCNGLHQIMTLHFFIYIQSVHTWSVKSRQPHITKIVDIKEAIAGMKEKFEIIGQMFNGFDYQAYFKVDTAQKLQVLLGAENATSSFIASAPGLGIDIAKSLDKAATSFKNRSFS
jgi:type I site-specific restriction-modification system R (restriction) subunit